MLNPVPRHEPRKATFLTSGLHAHAASVYTYTHPHDGDMDHKNASHCSTGDLAYFPPASIYHHTSSRAQSPPRKRRTSITSAASPMSPMKLTKSPAAPQAMRGTSPTSQPALRDPAAAVSSRTSPARRPEHPKRQRWVSSPHMEAVDQPTPHCPPLRTHPSALPLCAPARPPLSRLAIQPHCRQQMYSSPTQSSPSPPVPSSPSSEFYHAPGVWKSFGTIDEMKEN
ncbi:hypothetical protein B0H14DRAFT_3452198 [Mycena olivaceomarginata]|nr:hypothetical protein B0H14DRAFT_3452198 [Mycena olivaceomarginata]